MAAARARATLAASRVANRSSSRWIARSAPLASASRRYLLCPRRPGGDDHHLAAVLFLLPQSLFQRVRVRLIHFIGHVLTNPRARFIQLERRILLRNLLNTNQYFHRIVRSGVRHLGGSSVRCAMLNERDRLQARYFKALAATHILAPDLCRLCAPCTTAPWRSGRDRVRRPWGLFVLSCAAPSNATSYSSALPQ